MIYPSPDEYQELIQGPRSFFSDPDLQSRIAATNRLGLPRGLSGGFAITYEMAAGGSKKAVRCFKREIQSREYAYQNISSYLAKIHHCPHFVGFEYQPRGIRYKQKLLPCLKMDWVEGETLAVYLQRKETNSSTFANLRDKFSELAKTLARYGIAHGDIQPDNVIVQNDATLKLIDYDGLYVPGLTSAHASEVGLAAYQHPDRSLTSFGPAIDRFSFIVLDVILAAFSAQPSLRQQFPGSDQSLFFEKEDFLDPFGSKRFAAIFAVPQVSSLGKNLAAICLSPIEEVPSVSEFRASINIPTPTRAPRPIKESKEAKERIISALRSAGRPPPASGSTPTTSGNVSWERAALLGWNAIVFTFYLAIFYDVLFFRGQHFLSLVPNGFLVSAEESCEATIARLPSFWDSLAARLTSIDEERRKATVKSLRGLFPIGSCRGKLVKEPSANSLPSAGPTSTPTSSPTGAPEPEPASPRKDFKPAALCIEALTLDRNTWEPMPNESVTEAMSRGYTLETCRALINQEWPTAPTSPSGNSPSPGRFGAASSLELCISALNFDHSDWSYSLGDAVDEAKKRGYSVADCRGAVAQAWGKQTTSPAPMTSKGSKRSPGKRGDTRDLARSSPHLASLMLTP
jgi:serine/threonine protein kinase